MADGKPTKIDRVIKLKLFQDKFIFSQKRFPALISAWGTGKTMCLIEKARLDCERYPNNQGLIVRKEFRDLQDSTCHDWEKYTGIKINSSRNAQFPNGSQVMFRHAEELTGDNLSNMNLGFAGLEQAEEFDKDDVVFKLDGRLRREGVPHWCGVIGNTRGQNWIYNLWKVRHDEDFGLWEATTFDNADNLPADSIESWRKLKERKPKIYNRFVLNSWDEDDCQDACINFDHIAKAIDRRQFSVPPFFRIIGVDVARKGSNKTVAYALENGLVLGKMELEKKDTMETVGHLLLFAEKHKKINSFSVDELNAGAGVVDRLLELGKEVIAVNSSCKSSQPEKYRNVRAEVWGWGADQFENGLLMLPKEDKDLIEQLKWARWKSIDSNRVFQVELKEDIISRYGRSPDNADAYLYGLWGMQKIAPVMEGDKTRKRYYCHPHFDIKEKFAYA